MKTFDELELEKEVLESQLDLVKYQLDNFGNSKEKLQELVGKYYKGGCYYIHVKRTVDTKLWCDVIEVSENEIVAKHYPVKPEYNGVNYSPLYISVFTPIAFVEISKEEYENIIYLQQKIVNNYKLYIDSCKELIKSI